MTISLAPELPHPKKQRFQKAAGGFDERTIMEIRSGLVVLLGLVLAAQCTPVHGQDVVNADRIFNAIHDSMRQFGSSLNHNGMSIFLASVPKGTELYHGTMQAGRINKTEWVAFEPEHAMMFARDPFNNATTSCEKYAPTERGSAGGLQVLFNSPKHGSRKPNQAGYLHTYRAKYDLRLLYVDGQSAAKSDKGTLDIQDYILLPKPPPNRPPANNQAHPPLPYGDVARAKNICHEAATEWQDRIDGVIRMEMGFEIIMCNFERSLDVVQIAKTRDIAADGFDEMVETSFNYYKIISARYEGIGGGRVRVDYSNFVTLFDFPDSMYFNDDGMPRVDNESRGLAEIRERVAKLAIRDLNADAVNWQAIADLVVARYADRIDYLTSGELTNITTFKAEVDRAVRPFIDYTARNATAEIERCSQQFMPSHVPKHTDSPLAQRVTLNITTTICSSLSSILYDEIDFLTAVRRIRDLKEWLKWSEWNKCRGCVGHEVCFLPIWPLGNKEDLETPRCRSDIFSAGNEYWLGDWKPPI